MLNNNRTFKPPIIDNNVTLGLGPDRMGVLFTDMLTAIRIPANHWLLALISGGSGADDQQVRVKLVHETFRYVNSEPTLEMSQEIDLQFQVMSRLICIPPNQQQLIEYYRNTLPSADYLLFEKYHKWNIRIESVVYQRYVTLDVVLICQNEKELPKNSLEYLMKTAPYTFRDFRLLYENCELYSNLFKVDCEMFQQFFGRNYPLVCTVKDVDSNPNIIGNNNMSIQNSFSRFARILMDLNLGKCMMIVKFETKDDNIKRKWCENGISYEGHCYKFFSTSNSGMKGSSAVFINSTLLNLETVKLLVGSSFDKALQTGGVRKVASRIGLSIGTSIQSLATFEFDQIFCLPQNIEDEFPITDGSGLARSDFFEEILEKTYAIPYFEMEKLAKHPEMKLSRRLETDYKNVSAIQVRMLGAKGVLQKIPDSLWKVLQVKWKFPDSTKVILRNSMIKFETAYYKKIDVLSYSSATGGSISRGVMSCLLERTDHREEMEEIFMNDLDDYLKEMEDNRNDPIYVCNYLLTGTGNTKEGLAKQLIMADHPLNNYFIDSVIRENIKTRHLGLVNDNLSFKINSHYCVSALGGVDESGELKEGEIHINCDAFTNSPYYLELDYVLVYRNPLGYEGDIQKLKIKKNPQSEFLKSRRNSITFAMSKGTRNPIGFMQGGDFDGDRYNIIFHPKIVKYFKQDESLNLDYNNNDIYEQFKKNESISSLETIPVMQPNTNPTIQDIIEEHINMFTENSPIGTLSGYTSNLRETTDIPKKKLASKLFADCIDSIKGSSFPYDLINIVKSKIPEWEEYLNERVKKSEFWKDENLSNPQPNHLVCRMFDMVVQSLKKITEDPINTQLDPDFETPNPKYLKFHTQWKQEFENLFKEWCNYWTKQLSANPETEKDKSETKSHKRILLNKIKEILPLQEEKSESIDWRAKFNEGTDGNDMRCEKAAFFMRYNHVQNQKGLIKRLQSPFVYTCCMLYLNIYKQFKQFEKFGKIPQIVSSNYKVSLKKQLSNITRTTPVE
ncbi:predicted protein [Naegleria gruberi]|uniref:RNA-dependent RNA polymerase n=1 Tax=Naegleria gruberi TaxID=5762 RepID=D2V7S1_NAEGR|nr:uncharacterized protein NAEGRDRAFT_64904 [Naegleria gruberi]EFC46921.1 predicted protein [Naegleria gruberi]|eukprot:XP_002679665.1 predicted protein [Naegleria gruberi strain NEG-M]